MERDFNLFWSHEPGEAPGSDGPKPPVPVYYPKFNPPLQPLSQSVLKSLIGTISSFIGLRYLDFLLKEPSQFDSDGVKPKCYQERTVTAPLEAPHFDPYSIYGIRKQLLSGISTVGFLLPKYVFKYSSTGYAEAFTLEMLAKVTTIPVPKVYQMSVYPPLPHKVCIVTEYIPGRTLEEAWPQLSFFAKLRIMWTIRGYVQQLRRLRREVPGPIDGSNCVGPYFSDSADGAGQMSSYSQLVEWWNHKILVSNKFGETWGNPSLITDSVSLVFSHGDIHPSNLILGDNGKLYMIDWQWSGFYPEWFEYACATRHWLLFFPRSWKWLLPLAVGYYKKDFMRIEDTSWALECAKDHVLSEEDQVLR